MAKPLTLELTRPLQSSLARDDDDDEPRDRSWAALPEREVFGRELHSKLRGESDEDAGIPE